MAPVDIQVEVANGNDPVMWVRPAAELPDGLVLNSLDQLQGVAFEVGSFNIQMATRDALGLVAEGTLTLEVGDPDISLAQLASPFLGVGEALTSHQEDFLDNVGNDSGSYYLGDLRAWVLAKPNLPFSANVNVRALIALAVCDGVPKGRMSSMGRSAVRSA